MELKTLRALLDALIDDDYDYAETTPINEDCKRLVGFEVYDGDVVFKFEKWN